MLIDSFAGLSVIHHTPRYLNTPKQLELFGDERKTITDTLKEELEKIIKLLIEIVTARLSPFDGNSTPPIEWQRKLSLCAYSIVLGILTLSPLKNGRQPTVKTELRLFDQGIRRQLDAWELMKIPISEQQRQELKEMRAIEEKRLTYLECLPTHGTFGREVQAIKRIMAAVYYHLDIDISSVRIGVISNLYDIIQPIGELKEFPDYQFFRKHIAANKNGIKQEIDHLKTQIAETEKTVIIKKDKTGIRITPNIIKSRKKTASIAIPAGNYSNTQSNIHHAITAN
ncbi:hypothetical protein L4G92_00055 [Neisseria sp. ZJ106]|uniref:Uncharacterized protein n=1 Tax=Neisseria lisongii TaxID=2912188 RepID=A0ABY7RK28_9NEIS|nr:hypothetical protein [Neisseria lisongii]MCF7520451.1 hypothetical protein [Neisseria lisongii]WCL71606.1 hypothetical protein PJU73_00305 [Neisseria lisongii]